MEEYPIRVIVGLVEAAQLFQNFDAGAIYVVLTLRALKLRLFVIGHTIMSLCRYTMQVAGEHFLHRGYCTMLYHAYCNLSTYVTCYLCTSITRLIWRR